MRLRDRWNIGRSFFPDLLNVLQSIFPKEYSGFKLEIVPDDQLPFAVALTDGRKNKITIGQKVADAAWRLESWALYILAEEIGHFILKQQHVRYRKHHDEKVLTSIEGLDERQAKKFASIFVAPNYLIPENATIDDLVRNFPLSRKAAALRLAELEELGYRKRGVTKQLPHDVVRLLKRKAADPKPKSREGARFDLELELNMPPEGAVPIVDIEQSSSNSRCVLWGYASDGNLINVEVHGSEKRRELPFARNKVFVQFLTGGAHLKITVVDYRQLVSVTIPKTQNAFEYLDARMKGYESDPCPVCMERTVRRDGNCFTCDCGWTSSTS